MAKETKTQISYEVDLLTDGLRLYKVTKTVIKDGRGTRWSEGTTEREGIADLSAMQVAHLIETAASSLGYVAQHGWDED